MPFRLICAVAFLVIVAGCEKKQGSPEAGSTGAAPAPAAGGGTAAQPAGAPAAAGAEILDPAKVANPATITGTITVDGTVPAPSPVDMSSKPECVMLHGGKPVNAENLDAGANKELKNVFVYVKKGLEKYSKFAVPAKPVEIDQKGCVYVPHVFGIQVGQDLEIVNGDTFLHNVKNNDIQLNLAQPSGAKPEIKKAPFKRESVPSKFQCDVHSWMNAYACVVKHPYYSVTGADGKFTIQGLPAGKYTLAVWHEVVPGLKAAQTEVEVEVKDGETKTQDFKYNYAP